MEQMLSSNSKKFTFRTHTVDFSHFKNLKSSLFALFENSIIDFSHFYKNPRNPTNFHKVPKEKKYPWDFRNWFPARRFLCSRNYIFSGNIFIFYSYIILLFSIICSFTQTIILSAHE